MESMEAKLQDTLKQIEGADALLKETGEFGFLH